MFTMRDFSKIKNGIKCMEPETHFSPKVNMLAYTISRMGSAARGECGEKLMARYLRRHKYHVSRFGNVHPFDLLLDGRLKCEIKSATMQLNASGNRTQKYVLNAVKPEHFDILFMVFVTPKGIVAKWTEQKHVINYVKNRKRQRDGYYIYFDGACDNPNIAYNDSMNDFVKYYPSINTKLDKAIGSLLRKEL